jgi:hypothetical protein
MRSSSPSGSHVGHCKVITNSDTLPPLFTKMIQMTQTMGYSPKWWQEIVDVMLEKNPGDTYIHRLHIIALQESDYNKCNRLMIVRPVLQHIKDQKLFPDLQFGSRPAKQCITAVLTKVLQLEIQRYKKQNIAYIQNDAMGCYD